MIPVPAPQTQAYQFQGLYSGSFNELSAWGAPPSKIASIWGSTLGAPVQPEGNSAAGFSTSSQTTYEDEFDCRSNENQPRPRRDTQDDPYQCKAGPQSRGVLSRDGTQGRQGGGESSPLNTSGSSLTEEIFNHALSNLEFLSDEENDAPKTKDQIAKRESPMPSLSDASVKI